MSRNREADLDEQRAWEQEDQDNYDLFSRGEFDEEWYIDQQERIKDVLRELF